MKVAISKHSLSDLSARFELELRGDGEYLIDGVGTLMDGGPSQITFLANRSYRKELPETNAGVVILTSSAPLNPARSRREASSITA